jgi:hypothetical protein
MAAATESAVSKVSRVAALRTPRRSPDAKIAIASRAPADQRTPVQANYATLTIPSAMCDWWRRPSSVRRRRYMARSRDMSPIRSEITRQWRSSENMRASIRSLRQLLEAGINQRTRRCPQCVNADRQRLPVGQASTSRRDEALQLWSEKSDYMTLVLP